MALTLLQIDFGFDGPWGEQLHLAARELATDIAHERGLRWKVWTEDPAGGRAGGVYLFDDRALAAEYLEKHSRRLAGFGVSDLRALLLDVNDGLTQITRGPLDGGAA